MTGTNDEIRERRKSAMSSLAGTVGIMRMLIFFASWVYLSAGDNAFFRFATFGVPIVAAIIVFMWAFSLPFPNWKSRE